MPLQFKDITVIRQQQNSYLTVRGVYIFYPINAYSLLSTKFWIKGGIHAPLLSNPFFLVIIFSVRYYAPLLKICKKSTFSTRMVLFYIFLIFEITFGHGRQMY